MIPSAPPALDLSGNGNPPITSGTSSGVLGTRTQITTSQWPSFKREWSEDGSIVHRCVCGRAIKRMGDLKRHWRSRRHGGRGFDCLKCRRSYTREYMLNRHICQTKPETLVNAMEVDM